MIEPLLSLLIGVVLILAIIAANGYFVAQEFAYMSVDRTRLAAHAADGDSDAARALRVTRRTTFMLSGAQLGITVTGLLVGFVAEPLVGEALADLLGNTGIDPAVSISVGTVLTLTLAAITQMIVGELYPKNLAIASPEPLARRLARSTLLYLTVFGWLIAFFDHSANLLLRLLRIDPVHDLDVSASADDLPHIVATSRDSGDLPLELSLMIDRILDFPHRDVEHAMIPRSQVDWVRPTTTLGELRALMARAHTRYPVIDDNDTPVGVVHLADVMPLPRDADDTPVSAVMRPASVIHTLMRLPDALTQLTATRNELACVIDEYGGFAGVLTLEDLAEEVVGEITDEHDIETGEMVIADGDNEWLMDGDVHLDEVQRAIGRGLPRGDVETIAGLVIATHGALPQAGDTVVIELPVESAELLAEQPIRYRIEVDVLDVERHVPAAVRVRLLERSERAELDRSLELGAEHPEGAR